MINILDQIISNFINPTKIWPEVKKERYTYDLMRRSLDGFSLNSSLDLAKQFGRAKYVKKGGAAYLHLYYPSSGMILEFSSNKLIAIQLVISSESYHVRESKMETGNFYISVGFKEYSLNASTTLNDLISYLGKPEESGMVGKDMVHTFIINGNFIDSYHHSTKGTLLNVEICEAMNND